MLAGWYHGCNCVMGCCKCSCFFAKRHVGFYTAVFLLPLSATHWANMGYMELGSCSL